MTTPDSTSEVVEKHFGPGPHPGTGTPQAVHSAKISVGDLAQQAHARAQALEPELSALIQRVAGPRGAEFVGWEHRVKGPKSIRRKLLDIMKTKNMGLDDAFGDLKDTNRYTLVYSQVDGALERGVNDVVQDMAEEGWHLMRRGDQQMLKNYFTTRNDAYDGINSFFEKGDQRVEIQFHTPGSVIKKEQAHLIYERYRPMNWETRKAKTLFQEMVGIWSDGSHLPEDIPKFAFGMEV